MKKTVLALAVTAFATAGAANAAEVYSKGDVSVQLSGEANAMLKTGQLKQGTVKTKADPNVQAYGKIQLDTQYQISSSTSAFASFEFEGWSDASGVVLDDAVVGFTNDAAGTFSFGETGDAFDAIEKTDITNEGIYAATAEHPTESKGKGVRWQKDLAGVKLSLDAQTTSGSEDNYYGASVDWAINDTFSVAAAYLEGGKQAGVKTNSYGLSAAADLDNFYIAATVTQYSNFDSAKLSGETEKEIRLGTGTEGMTYGVALAYQWDATRFYGTYAIMDAKEMVQSGAKVDASFTALTVGADHALTDNVKVFLEYTNAETDGKNATKASADSILLGGYFTF